MEEGVFKNKSAKYCLKLWWHEDTLYYFFFNTYIHTQYTFIPFDKFAAAYFVKRLLLLFFLFIFFLNNFVCTGMVPDPTSLFLPTSFCM